MANTQKSSLAGLLVLVVVISCLVSQLGAVPLSRILLASGGHLGHSAVDVADNKITQEEVAVVLDEDEAVNFEGRIDMERNDYSGSGPNNRHDPRTPGRA